MTSVHTRRRVCVAAVAGALGILGILGVLSTVAARQALAQPQQGAAPPAANPAPQPGSSAASPPTKAPAVPPSEAPAAHGLVGLYVFSSDGTRVGEVKSVNTGPKGDVVGLHVRTGGFLGFGGRVIAIPEGKFIRSGQSIRLDLDADQVNALPELKD